MLAIIPARQTGMFRLIVAGCGGTLEPPAGSRHPSMSEEKSKVRRQFPCVWGCGRMLAHDKEGYYNASCISCDTLGKPKWIKHTRKQLMKNGVINRRYPTRRSR